MAGAITLKMDVDTLNGRHAYINKARLSIDPGYGREPSALAVRKIANSWNPVLLNTIQVAERPDGTTVILDGGHRHAAAMRLEHIQKLPCMVYKVPSRAMEAAIYHELNNNRRGMSAYDRWRAGVIAGDHVCLALGAALKDHGLKAVSSGAGPGRFRAIAGALRMFQQNEPVARGVLAYCHRLAKDGEQIITERVMSGLFYVATKIPEADIFGRGGVRIMLHGTDMEMVDNLIGKDASMVGKGSARLSASTLLKLINKHVHESNRIAFPVE